MIRRIAWLVIVVFTLALSVALVRSVCPRAAEPEHQTVIFQGLRYEVLPNGYVRAPLPPLNAAWDK